MRPRHRHVLVAALGAAMFVLVPATRAATTPPAYAPNEVIVRFRDSVTPARRQAILADLGVLDAMTLGTPSVERLRFSRGDVDAAVARYAADPDLVYIQPNFIWQALVTPNDPQFPQMWALENRGQTGGTPGADIRATSAWSATTGDSGVLVGVIDTGVDYFHPDLAANIWTNPGEIPGNGVDDDGNGYVDDVHGYDFVNNDADPMDDVGHGTHVAGTIGAAGNNGIGTVGVCWNIRIMPLKFLGFFGGTSADAIRAIRYATQMGARLTNNSWGGGGYDQALYDAIAEARDAGVLFVAAAANNGVDNDVFPNYPSSYDLSNIIAVAATDHNDALATFSNYGATTVDLAAPGVDILSTLPSGGYGVNSGTSMATPHVSGVLGLMFSRFPTMNAASAKSLLLARVTPKPGLAGKMVTEGRLDALLPVADPDSIPPDPVTDLRLESILGEAAALAWTATGDDGSSGQASAYDLRYSPAPIDEANFGSATRVALPVSPGPAGSAERDTVTELQFQTTYYFALRALDEFGNASPISNVASGTTQPPPDIDVTPTEVSAALLTGESAERAVTIANSGPSELRFRIQSRTGLAPALAWRSFSSTRKTDDPPSPPPASGPAATYRPPGYAGRVPSTSSPTRVANVSAIGGFGIALLTSGTPAVALRRELLLFPDIERVDEIDVLSAVPDLATLALYDAVVLVVNVRPGNPAGLGDVLADYADGGGGVILTLASFINGWNVAGRLLDDGYLPFTLGSGPAGSATLGAFDAGHPIMRDVLSASGDLLGVTTVAPGAELVASWSNGLPFVATQGATVVGINAFFGDPGFWGGDVPLIVHNSVLWSGGGQWLSAQPRDGLVAPNSSLVLAVRLNAEGLDGGAYDGRLDIQSNDPDEPVVSVAAHLDVTGAPRLIVGVEPLSQVSTKSYVADGDTTRHEFETGSIAPASGSFTLAVEGDYGDFGETATLFVEDDSIGSVGAIGIDCSAARRTFPVTAAQLQAWGADGRIDAWVVNSIAVNAFCLTNQHEVQLALPRSTDPLDFGAHFVGLAPVINLTLRNSGTEILNVDGITVDGAGFTAGLAGAAIPPRSERVLPVTFRPTAAERYAATLRFTTNDVAVPSFEMALAGEGVLPPDIAVEPTSFEASVLEGGTDQRVLHVSNVGVSDLIFDVDVLPPGLLVSTPFGGLSPAAATVASQNGEPRYRVASTITQPLAGSPVPVTCLADDPVAGVLYAHQLPGNRFFRYVAATDAWDELAMSPLYAYGAGGAAVLNGKVYVSFPFLAVFGAYDVATNTWTTIPGPDGSTGITTDGSRYLYLVNGTSLTRFDPVTLEADALAPPPFAFSPFCGLRFFENKLYGYGGSGFLTFGVYDTDFNTWRLLPMLPDYPAIGAAIDPIGRRFVTGGPYGGTTVMKFDVDVERWTVGTMSAFAFSDGGFGWLPGPVAGVIAAQGGAGTGLARILEKPEFVTVTPSSGRVAAGNTLDLDVRFDSAGLLGGVYDANLELSSNDPDEPVVRIPARLTVTGTPDLVLAGEPVQVSSSMTFDSDGDSTRHALSLPAAPAGSGTLALDYAGDFGDFFESATVVVEGAVLGTTQSLGFDCTSGHADFAVSASDLARWSEDGVVDVLVVNSFEVQAFCPLNEHRVTLSYSRPATSLDFGEVFIGTVAERQIVVSNRGSAPLIISSIASSLPRFSPAVASLTVAPRASVALAVRFSPTAVDSQPAQLVFTSNDPDTPTQSITLTGAGVLPPRATVAPTALTESIGAGETIERPLTLANAGGSGLTFQVSVLSGTPGTDSLRFEGLSRDSVAASNNPAPRPRAFTDQSEPSGEPRFHAGTGEILSLPRAPATLTCVAGDPESRVLYAQENFGNRMFRFDAETDQWSQLGSAPINSDNNGGAALLRGRVFTSYTGPALMGIYQIDSGVWTTMSHPMNRGTGVIASDDRRYLYFAEGFDFVRWDIETGQTASLPNVPLYMERWGGLVHFEGALYAHTGNGTTGFAKFDVLQQQWSVLPPVPGGAVLGSAIDPGTREFVAYGSYGGNNLYRYSLDRGTWSVSTLPYWQVFDGGMAWLPSSRHSGVHMVEGELGTGLAVLIGVPGFIEVQPLSGTVGPGGTQELSVLLGGPTLPPGMYHGRVAIDTNDPLNLRLEVPVDLDVRTVPLMELAGARVEGTSMQSYGGTGASTFHVLELFEVPTGALEFDLRTDGDYSDFGETATLTVEGFLIGEVGGTGSDCAPASRTFTVSDSLRDAIVADRRVDAVVQNSFGVDAFCPSNLHTVTVAYRISIDPLDFGPVFVGASRTAIVSVLNTGTAPLTVQPPRIEGAGFSTPTGTLVVPPGEEDSIEVRFTPAGAGSFAGTLTVHSDAFRSADRVVEIRGEGVVPPAVQLSPDAFALRLGPGVLDERTLRIGNSGGAPLTWKAAVGISGLSSASGAISSQAVPFQADVRIPGGPSLDAGDPPLADILAALDAHAADVTGAIPDRYDFTEGEVGVQIVDGGLNMFDGGNILSTNLGGPLSYANGVPRVSSVLGPGGRYFTRKYPGLFVLVADIRSLSSFHIAGNLGANGAGSVASAVMQSPGSDHPVWMGFSKRVYGAGVPSVNHLIVVESNPVPVHQFDTFTDNDDHRVLGLNTNRRLYYLLYSGRAGAFTSDATTRDIMDRFLDVIDPGRRWLTLSPESGVVAPGGAQDVSVRLDTRGLGLGDYGSEILLETNAPATPLASVPVELSVVTDPVIAAVPDSLDFGTVFVGFPATRPLTVRSLGGAPLVFSVASSDPAVTVSAPPASLAPGTTATLDATYAPAAPGALAGTMTVSSNDPFAPQVTVAVTGSAVTPPQMDVSPPSVSALVSAGFSRAVPLRFCNSGGYPLSFVVVADSTAWLGGTGATHGELAPGECRTDTLRLDGTHLTPGIYTTTLRVYSNDPDEPEISVAILLHVVPVVAASLDVVPDVLEPKSHGKWATAKVTLPPPYGPEDVALSTVRLMGSIPAFEKGGDEDDNDDDGDGDDDDQAAGSASGPDDMIEAGTGNPNADGSPQKLTLKFSRAALIALLPPGDRVDVTITGELLDGRSFFGHDSVRIKRPKVRHPNGGEHLASGSIVNVEWDEPAEWNVTRAEVHLTADGGASWHPLVTGASGGSFAWVVPGVQTVAARIRVLLFDAEDLIGVAESEGAFSITGSVNDAGPLADAVVELSLVGAAPNPFRGSTMVRFALPAAARVRLEVFDLNGRRCRVLEDGVMAAGRHQSAWNGRDDAGRRLAAGVYVVRMDAGGRVLTRRVARLQ